MKSGTTKNFENQKTATVTNGTGKTSVKTADRDRANRIRAALLFRGMSMADWARKRGYSLPTVWTAAYKLRAGKLARKIHAELEQLLDA